MEEKVDYLELLEWEYPEYRNMWEQSIKDGESPEKVYSILESFG